MKPVSRWKTKYPSVNSLSQPLSLIREKQPLIDVFDEKNHFVILAQLPGIDEKDVKIKADENSVTITAQNATRQFLETIRLPTCIKKDTMRFTYRNNILQARLKKTASYSVVKSLQVNG
ncbi:MAG: Hsp20/alpha crystallin family protein [Candidatus Bathyarchaeia archaeon]|jgi:HSP20 family molecular chaperone IbpA